LAKISRSQQRRLVATSIAFVLTAAIMMPTTTDAHGGGGGGGGHGVRNINILGFPRSHTIPRSAGLVAVRRIPPHHVFPQRRVAFRHSHVVGSRFFTLGADGIWIDSVESGPTIVVTQQPAITAEPTATHRAAAVRTPDAQQDGILVVRGNSKAYVTFSAAKSG
jgi:hypothetical protein